MRTKEEAIQFGLSFPDSYIDRPFRTADWELIRFRENKKAFLLIYERNGLVNLNVKVHPEWRDFWRRVYPAVQPAYRQNKEHWNSIILDGSIPEEELRRMISESYSLISDSPTKRIYEAVKKIPKGRVATYAEVAEIIRTHIVGESLDLIETLAVRIAQNILDECAYVHALEVTVNKPKAPIEVTFGNVAVTVFREREGTQIQGGKGACARG